MSLGSVFIIFIYFAGAAIGAFYESTSFDTTSANALVNFQVLKEVEVNIIFTSFTVPVPNLDFFTGLGHALLWNSPMWNGSYSYLRIMILVALTFGFFFPIVVSLFGARVGKATL